MIDADFIISIRSGVVMLSTFVSENNRHDVPFFVGKCA